MSETALGYDPQTEVHPHDIQSTPNEIKHHPKAEKPTPDKKDYSPQRLEQGQWRHLIVDLVADLDSENPISPEVFNSIWGRYVKEQVSAERIRREDTVDDHSINPKVDPVDMEQSITALVRINSKFPPSKYPEVTPHLSIVNSWSTDDESVDWDNPVPPGKSHNFPNGLYQLYNEETYNPAALEVTLAVFKQLKPDDQKKLAPELVEYLLSGVPSGLEKRTLQLEISSTSVDFHQLLEEYSNSHPWEYPSSALSLADYRFYDLGHDLPEEDKQIIAQIEGATSVSKWLDEMSSRPVSEMLEGLKISFTPREYVRLINAVRDKLKAEDLSQTQREHLVRLGKLLLGLDVNKPEFNEGNFFLTLESLYDSVRFENYKNNQGEATRIESDIIQSVVKSYPGSAQVVDLGCGTGRHLVELTSRPGAVEQGGDKDYIGLEIQERHIELARQNLGNPDKIVSGSMYKMPFEASSIGVLYAAGCDVSHSEDGKTFSTLMDEAYRTLKPGGMFVFDIPDPDTGIFPEHRRRYIQALEQIGVHQQLIDYAQKSQIEFIVDGPGDDKLYNRYVPNATRTIKETSAPRYTSTELRAYFFLPRFLTTRLVDIETNDGHGRINTHYLAFKPDFSSEKLTPKVIGLMAKHDEVRQAESDMFSTAIETHSSLGQFRSRVDVISREKTRFAKVIEKMLLAIAKQQLEERLTEIKSNLKSTGLTPYNP